MNWTDHVRKVINEAVESDSEEEQAQKNKIATDGVVDGEAMDTGVQPKAKSKRKSLLDNVR
jgi:hypothetical protein